MHFWRVEAIRVQELHRYWKKCNKRKRQLAIMNKETCISWYRYFYGNNDIAPGVGQARYSAVSEAIRCASWCPNHAPDVETGESRGLRVSRRLYAAYVRSRARHRDRQISRSSGVMVFTASCELSLLIAGAVELPHFQ